MNSAKFRADRHAHVASVSRRGNVARRAYWLEACARVVRKGKAHAQHQSACQRDIERAQLPDGEECGEPTIDAGCDVHVEEVANESYSRRRDENAECAVRW